MHVVICDGNRILGEALAAALEACDREVTAVATSTADDCIASITRNEAEVCVLDPHLPEVPDCLQVIRKIRNSCPGTALVLVSDPSQAMPQVQARELGLAGLLGKNRSVSQVAEALHAIVAGQPAFDRVPQNGASRPAAPSALTPRESEVLRRIAAGQHTQQMATEMNIATSTLRTYVKNLFAKLGVHSRLEAAAVASRADLLGETIAGPLPARSSSTG